MKITTADETLQVSDLREFGPLEADDLIRDLRAALQPSHSTVEFDFALLRSADCDTADALLAVYAELDRGETARVWRVANPSSDLRQLFELVRLHHFFEITPPRPPRMILL